MRLLLGFESPDSGTVTYDGRELATLDSREVRRQIGTVLQHSELMPSDIFNNIVGFAPFLTMDDAWRAARMAGLEDDIRAMPMGMHTLVGEGGGNLSTGQKQRLLIARAIVRGPKILLFDEATSALDNVTQSIISDSLTNQLRGVTRVVIAHRLDAIVNADRIYVVKDGRIVQAGRYEQLMEEPGPFRDLARAKFVERVLLLILILILILIIFLSDNLTPLHVVPRIRPEPEPPMSKKRKQKPSNKTAPMTFEQVRSLALALPKVADATSYGTPAFKVAGKLIARLHQDGESLVVKIDPGERAMRMNVDPETFYITDHYLNYPWILARIARVAPDDLRDLLEEAWRLTVPARLVSQRDKGEA